MCFRKNKQTTIIEKSKTLEQVYQQQQSSSLQEEQPLQSQSIKSDGMTTPEDTDKTVKDLQEKDIGENVDYQLLKQQETHLNNVLNRQENVTSKLRLLYEKLEGVRNHQEFTDMLANNKTLLREIFTLEGAQRNQSTLNHVAPNIDWSKYGVDIEDYIAQDDELLSLQDDGLL